MKNANEIISSDTEDLKKNYAKNSAFGASLGVGTRQALVMIDFSKAYFDPQCQLYANVPQVIPVAVDLLNWARERQMLICHTRVEYDKGGVNGGVFFRKLPALVNFCHGNSMGDFVVELEPKAGEVVITKQYASAFFGTSLASLLRANGIDCVLLAGMSTSGCVRASTVDAVQNGFIPIVVSDACGDRHPDPHNANLFDLQAKYADVIKFNDLRVSMKPSLG